MSKLTIKDQYEGVIRFFGPPPNSVEFLRLEPSGDIFVKGRLAENDKEVVASLREFLAQAGMRDF